MSKDMGVSPSGIGLASPEGPEPHSGLRPSGGIPDADDVSEAQIDAAIAEKLANELFRRTMQPYREHAEAVRDEFEASFVGEDADLKGLITESYVAFGTACAHHAAEDLHEYWCSEKMRWNADMRAIKRWQDATGERLTWPDHADLVVWLLEQLDAAQGMEARQGGDDLSAPSRSDDSPVP